MEQKEIDLVLLKLRQHLEQIDGEYKWSSVEEIRNDELYIGLRVWLRRVQN